MREQPQGRNVRMDDETGDDGDLARLRLTAVEERLRDRKRGSQSLLEGDVALIIIAAVDQQGVQQHERALELLAAARLHADQHGWRRWSVRASLLAVMSMVALLDFDAAASSLRTVLGLASSASLGSGDALERSRALSVAGTP